MEAARKKKREYLALARWAGIVNKEYAVQKPWGKEGKQWRMYNSLGVKQGGTCPGMN